MPNYKTTINRLYLLTLLLLLSGWTLAQNPCNTMFPYSDTTDWGKGLIWLPKDSKIKLTNAENRQAIATLYRTKYDYSFELKLVTNDGSPLTINDYDIIQVGSVGYKYFKVYEINNSDKYLILKQSKSGGLWVSKNDLDSANAKYFSYHQMLFDNRETMPEEVYKSKEMANIGVNLTGICLNMRKEPSINSEKIWCINSYNNQSDSHTHFKIKDFKGDWALVEATYYVYAPELDDAGEGCAFKVQRKETGWVKAIADNGYLNIWFSVTTY